MIVIGGTQRAGTSFLSSVFKELKFDLGTELWDEEINGGLESPFICKYIRTFLEKNNIDNASIFPFEDYWKRVSFNETYYETFIQKFSFILMNPKFIKAYINWRPQDSFLIMLRNPLEVIQSKRNSMDRQKRFNLDHFMLKQTPEELSVNVINSLIILSNAKIKFEIISFPFLLRHPEIVFEKLIKLNSKLPLSKTNFLKVWNNKLDLSKNTVKLKEV